MWQSPDPIIGEYMSGQTNGGVFNPKNLSLFTYTYNNPINFIDPNGESTHIDSDGNVFSVNPGDNDLGVYQHASNMCEINPNKVGETMYADEFISPEDGSTMTNYKIQVGKSFDPIIESMHEKSKDMDLKEIASNSKKGKMFDIKTPYKNVDALLNGKYATSRSAGNFLAGYNAESATYFGVGVSFETFQKLAGGLHIENSHGKNLSTGQMIDIVLFGTYESSDISKFKAPTYGEVPYQHRMSEAGWNHGKNE